MQNIPYTKNCECVQATQALALDFKRLFKTIQLRAALRESHREVERALVVGVAALRQSSSLRLAREINLLE